MTPFEILYGRKPPTLARYIRGSTSHATLDELFLERDVVLTVLKANLWKAQERMREVANKSRHDIQFTVDDWVYVKLQPYRQGTARLQRHHKLGLRYFGPYRVVARVGEVAYRLELPETAKIHPVFHVSLLRKCIGKPENQITPLHLVDYDSTLMLQPEQIIATREVTKGQQQVTQSLIKWAGMTEAEATWEDNTRLQQMYPDLNLADKVCVDGEGIVENSVKPQNSEIPKEMAIQDTGQVNENKQSSRRRNPPTWAKDYVMLAQGVKEETQSNKLSPIGGEQAQSKKKLPASVN